MSDPTRDNKIGEMYKNMAAEFLERESTIMGLMTVTDILMSRNRKDVTILFTVFPDKYQEQALIFTRRIRSDFRDYVKDKMKYLATMPIFDFAIDFGEKNRQRIDTLVQKIK